MEVRRNIEEEDPKMARKRRWIFIANKFAVFNLIYIIIRISTGREINFAGKVFVIMLLFILSVTVVMNIIFLFIYGRDWNSYSNNGLTYHYKRRIKKQHILPFILVILLTYLLAELLFIS